MIEKDYIMRLLLDLGKVIAKLLFLKNRDCRDEMEQVVYEGLKIAELDGELSEIDEDAVNTIEDERVLASLSEAITIYLSVNENENLSRINNLIAARLKEKKALMFDNFTKEK